MTELGVGEEIYQLRKKIQQLSLELNHTNSSPSKIPELINSANLLRSNDFLNATNSKQSEIITLYEKYVKELEAMLNNVFEIQMELKDILKMQTSLMIDKKTTKNRSSRNKKPRK